MEHTIPKWCVVFSTAIYLLLFPVLLWGALLWGASTEPSSVWDLLTLFTWFWIPVSIPLSIYFTWSRYCKGKYEYIRLFCLLPVLVLGAFIAANMIIDVLESLFT